MLRVLHVERKKNALGRTRSDAGRTRAFSYNPTFFFISVVKRNLYRK